MARLSSLQDERATTDPSEIASPYRSFEEGFAEGFGFSSERERASKENVEQAEAIYRKWRGLLRPFLPETVMTATGDSEALDELSAYLKRASERERALREALAKLADEARHALLTHPGPGPQMLNAKWVLDFARAALEPTDPAPSTTEEKPCQ